MKEDMATDIVVRVSNPKETAMVGSKIKLLFPDTRIITKEDLKVSYKNIFDYKDDSRLSIDNLPTILNNYDPGRRIFIELKFGFKGDSDE